MAFPTTTTQDDFNTGASQALTARAFWSSTARASGSMSTDSVPTYATAGGSVFGNMSNAVFAADQEVWATFETAPGAGGVQLEARWDIAAGNGYALIYTGGILNIRVVTGFSGAAQVGSNYSVTPATGDSFGLELIGTTISAYYKTAAGSWTQVVTGTDSTYNTSGRINVLGFGSPGAQIGSFGGGEIVTVSPQAGVNFERQGDRRA